jgi:low temperature requirement protein LtrA
VCLVATLWWVYFDGVADAGERRLAALPPGQERNRQARICYTLLHLPLFAGDILVSLGIHAALQDPSSEFTLETSTAMFSGLAAYLLALVGFRLCTTGTLNRARLATALLLLVLIPLAQLLPGWAALTGTTAVMVALIVVERIPSVGARTPGP